jgi:glycosyltransferase involved in cell wall biosynthesis
MPQEVVERRRMKFAQVMAGAPTGGAELFFERLTGALANAGETVLPVIRRDAARAARLYDAGLHPVQLGFAGPLDLVTRFRLLAALRRFAPRVAVAWMGRAAQAAPSGDWVLVGRLGGYYDLRRFRHCDHLVGNTRALSGWIVAQGWPAARTHYLPNFVPDLAGAAPAKLGVPAGARLLLALGRLHRNKGFDVLIRALPALSGVHLMIAGEGQEREELVALARRQGVAGRLHLPGWRADTAALLSAADMLVCPSRQEPLGNVVLEAWSARRPVVAAAADGPRELITAGQDGLLVPPEDPAALAKAVSDVLDSPDRAKALADAGRLRYEAEFAEPSVVAGWRQFLATVEKP